MAYHPGQAHGHGPDPYPPQSNQQYQPVLSYPGQAPPYPQQSGSYPPHPGQPTPQYPSQPVPQYPSQPVPQYPGQGAPPYPHQSGSFPPHSGGFSPPGGHFPGAPARQTESFQTDAPPPTSSAPPNIEGYRDIGFDGGFVRPPAQPLPSAPPPNQPEMTITQEPLTRDEVKDALAAFVAQHCCYGSGPIKDIQIRNIAPTYTFKYTLESFVEKREPKWKFEPFSGNSIQTGTGQPPGPWEVPLTPKELFKDEKRVLQVPNTQTLRPCHDCQAHGDTRCKHCAGRGQDRCGHCGGSGQRLGDACSLCAGIGTNKCSWCDGNGMITCTTCKGKRNLKYYVELTATWKVHTDKYVANTPGVPDSEVTAVSGDTVCQAQGHLLWPFTGFPENKIATASQHLVKKHQTGWPMARVLQQRHDVQQIPIHSISYEYSGKVGTFFVCGHEKQVFYPDYPSQCCGCCVVM